MRALSVLGVILFLAGAFILHQWARSKMADAQQRARERRALPTDQLSVERAREIWVAYDNAVRVLENIALRDSYGEVVLTETERTEIQGALYKFNEIQRKGIQQ